MGSSPKMVTSPGPIRVLTVDDCVIIREGIAALIANQTDMRLFGEASIGTVLTSFDRFVHGDVPELRPRLWLCQHWQIVGRQ